MSIDIGVCTKYVDYGTRHTLDRNCDRFFFSFFFQELTKINRCLANIVEKTCFPCARNANKHVISIFQHSAIYSDLVYVHVCIKVLPVYVRTRHGMKNTVQ